MANKFPLVVSIQPNTLLTIADRFLPIGGFTLGTETSEADTEARFKIAGTLSGLAVRTTSINSPSVIIRTRKNNSNGNLNVTANAIGFTEDTTNSDTVAVDDDIGLMYDQTSGQSGISVIRTLFEPSTGNTYPYIANSPGGLGIATLDRVLPIAGEITGTTLESSTNRKIGFAGTWQNMGVYVGSNSKTTTQTFKSRVDGVDGNMSISFTASSTGWGFDTSNTDSLSGGEYINGIVNISGSGTINYGTFYSEINYTASTAYSLVSETRTSSTRTASATATYLPILGGFRGWTTNTTESRAQISLGVAGTISNFAFWGGGTNGYTGSSTVRLRINGADGNISITVPAGVGNEHTNTTDTDTVAASDQICISVVGGTSGDWALKGVSFDFTPTAGTTRRIFMIT